MDQSTAINSAPPGFGVGTYKELLLGCGRRMEKLLAPPGDFLTWRDVTTLDREACHNPQVLWDLESLPWPFESDYFNEIHAYEVLEHLGDQGDWRAFFAHFEEVWRILKPGGYLMATVPWWESEWAWGDPGHRRLITPGMLSFLSRTKYRQGVGNGPMSDYRAHYKADFEVVMSRREEEAHIFVLRAVKRVEPEEENGHG